MKAIRFNSVERDVLHSIGNIIQVLKRFKGWDIVKNEKKKGLGLNYGHEKIAWIEQ